MYRYLFLLIITAVLSAGCDKKESVLDSKTTLSEETITDKQKRIIKKHNEYVSCNNSQLNQFTQLLESYAHLSSIEAEIKKSREVSKPTFSEQQCKDWDKLSKSQPTFIDADRSIAVLIPTIKKLYPLLHEASDYYSAKDYLEDDYAKAQTLHTKILTLLPVYFQAYSSFIWELQNKESILFEKKMTQAKDSEYYISYYTMLTVKKIEVIIDEISKQKHTMENCSQQTDLEKIRLVYEEFNHAQQQLRYALFDDVLLKKEGFSSDSIKRNRIDTFVRETTNFKLSILKIMDKTDRECEKRQSSNDTHPLSVNDGLGGVNDLYDQVIFHYNNLNFDENSDVLLLKRVH